MFDLSDPDAATRIAAAAEAALGRIDVLVNNAAIRIRHPFGEFSAAEFDRVFAVNLRAVLLLSQAVLPFMRRVGGGRIVHMASQLGLVADPGAALYGMSKAAMIHLTRIMALELSSENILVNAVSPGPVGTEYYLRRMEREPEVLRQRLAAVPAGRLGTPEEVAEAVVFLATGPAYVQGHNLVVDGATSSGSRAMPRRPRSKPVAQRATALLAFGAQIRAVAMSRDEPEEVERLRAGARRKGNGHGCSFAMTRSALRSRPDRVADGKGAAG